jgi:adenylylsulfate kinase
VLGSCTTLLIVLILTGKLRLSVAAGLLDAVSKVGAYFVHERIWDRITFGREWRGAGESTSLRSANGDDPPVA